MSKRLRLIFQKIRGDHSGSLESLVSSRENAENYMYQLYRDFVTTESRRKGYAAFLTEIAQDTQPFIFHCFWERSNGVCRHVVAIAVRG